MWVLVEVNSNGPALNRLGLDSIRGRDAKCTKQPEHLTSTSRFRHVFSVNAFPVTRSRSADWVAYYPDTSRADRLANAMQARLALSRQTLDRLLHSSLTTTILSIIQYISRLKRYPIA